MNLGRDNYKFIPIDEIKDVYYGDISVFWKIKSDFKVKLLYKVLHFEKL